MILLFIVIAGLLPPQIPNLLLPEGNGAWSVQLTMAGGVVGINERNYSLSSEGKIVCGSDLLCPKDFLALPFQPLIEMIDSTLPVPPLAVISFCSDCIRRTITISRRDATGFVHKYSATWDETTKSQLPEEVARVYDAITALVK